MPYIGKQPAAVPIDASDIPDNSIDASKIVDGAITVADIADDAVTEAKLANAINSAIDANTAKVTNYNQTKSDIDALGIAASSITGALPAIDGSALTGGVGLLVASGAPNGGAQTPTSASTQTHTVFTFTMPANKTKVVISGSWSYYTYQSNNGWTITKFEYTTNTGSLSKQANQWDGERKTGAGGLDNHGGHAQHAVLTGVSPGTSVTISIVMTPYNSALSWAYYNQAQCIAVAY